MFFPALKQPSPASSIIFQSSGMVNGTIEENKVIEETPEWENLETSKEGDTEEEEDFTESYDDPDDVEEEEEMDVEEVNWDFIRQLLAGLDPDTNTQSVSCCKLRSVGTVKLLRVIKKPFS